MNIDKIIDSVLSEYNLDLKKGTLLSNLSLVCTLLKIPTLISKLKLINLIFLHSHIESNSGKYRLAQQNQIVDLVYAIHEEIKKPEPLQPPFQLPPADQLNEPDDHHNVLLLSKPEGVPNHFTSLRSSSQMEETIIFIPIYFIPQKQQIQAQLRHLSLKSNTHLCHVEIKEMDNKPSIRAGVLFHTPNSNPNFKKEIIQFINEKPAEERLFTANRT